MLRSTQQLREEPAQVSGSDHSIETEVPHFELSLQMRPVIKEKDSSLHAPGAWKKQFCFILLGPELY